MNKCPICRGSIDVTVHQCFRCKSDLGFVFQIEEQAKHYCQLAVHYLEVGDMMQSLYCSQKALELKIDEFTQTLYAFCKEQVQEPNP